MVIVRIDALSMCSLDPYEVLYNRLQLVDLVHANVHRNTDLVQFPTLIEVMLGFVECPPNVVAIFQNGVDRILQLLDFRTIKPHPLHSAKHILKILQSLPACSVSSLQQSATLMMLADQNLCCCLDPVVRLGHKLSQVTSFLDRKRDAISFGEK